MSEDVDLTEMATVTAIPEWGKEELVEKLDKIIKKAQTAEIKTRTDTEIGKEIRELGEAIEELENEVSWNGWDFEKAEQMQRRRMEREARREGRTR